MTRARAGRTPLSAELVTSTALRMIDESGVEALSMRKLATELGVNPMSLYHHVANKDLLVRGAADLALAELALPDLAALPGTWQDQLRFLARQFRLLARRHRNFVVAFLADPRFLQHDQRVWTGLQAVLRAAGVPAHEVATVGTVVASFFSGLVLAEVKGLFELADGAAPDRADHAADEAIELIIAGLEARYCRRS